MAENKKEFSMDDVVIKRVKKGDLITGTIFKVESDVIYVTLENNREAKMYKNHFGKHIDSFIGVVNEGDTIDAIVSDIKETDEFSSILLDRNRMVKDENFRLVQQIYKEEKTVSVPVTKITEKGLQLNIHGFSAFLPYGLLDNELIRRKEELKDTELDVNIIEVRAGRRPRIIASRKKIFEEARIKAEEERQRLRKEEFDSINTGDILKGRVERIERHMALIRFNHIAGRLRISQISNVRIEKIEDELTIGDEVEVKVIKKDQSLDLSIKALLPTPIEEFAKEHKKGDKVVGRVVQKLPFGLILELKESVRGLLHRTEYSWNPDENFQDYVKIDDQVETIITLVDVKKRKISLSRKLLIDNPWANVHFERNEIVEAKVVEVNEDEIVVETKGVNGTIHISELSTKHVDDPAKLFKEDDVVKAQVIDFNKRRWILKLSIKRLLIIEEKADYEKHLIDDSEKTTLGDLFEDVLVEEPSEPEEK